MKNLFAFGFLAIIITMPLGCMIFNLLEKMHLVKRTMPLDAEINLDKVISMQMTLEKLKSKYGSEYLDSLFNITGAKYFCYHSPFSNR